MNELTMPKKASSIITVIGVGGAGGNAVNHMYSEGINGVTFMVCNTDSKALNDSPVPNKLQLGKGLGAGNKPEAGRKAAEDSIDEIKERLNDNTLMVFITAGMGGGTGTGAGKSWPLPSRAPTWSLLRPAWVAEPAQVPPLSLQRWPKRWIY